MRREQCSHEKVDAKMCETVECTSTRDTVVFAGWRIRHVCYPCAIRWEGERPDA